MSIKSVKINEFNDEQFEKRCFEAVFSQQGRLMEERIKNHLQPSIEGINDAMCVLLENPLERNELVARKLTLSKNGISVENAVKEIYLERCAKVSPGYKARDTLVSLLDEQFLKIRTDLKLDRKISNSLCETHLAIYLVITSNKCSDPALKKAMDYWVPKVFSKNPDTLDYMVRNQDSFKEFVIRKINSDFLNYNISERSAFRKNKYCYRKRSDVVVNKKLTRAIALEFLKSHKQENPCKS